MEKGKEKTPSSLPPPPPLLLPRAQYPPKKLCCWRPLVSRKEGTWNIQSNIWISTKMDRRRRDSSDSTERLLSREFDEDGEDEMILVRHILQVTKKLPCSFSQTTCKKGGEAKEHLKMFRPLQSQKSIIQLAFNLLFSILFLVLISFLKDPQWDVPQKI